MNNNDNNEPVAVLKITFDEFYYRDVLYLFFVLLNILMSLKIADVVFRGASRAIHSFRGVPYESQFQLGLSPDPTNEEIDNSRQRRFYHPFF
jgi:hypothetical protein